MTTLPRLLALALLVSAPDAHADVRITADHGGAVATYAGKVQALRVTGERVVIDGTCYSSCTLYLGLPPGQICATARGWFGFHRASDAITGLPSARGNEYVLSFYPPAVRAWLDRQGSGLMWDARGNLATGLKRAPARMFVAGCR